MGGIMDVVRAEFSTEPRDNRHSMYASWSAGPYVQQKAHRQAALIKVRL
jgi:hypothetical protein